MKVDLFVLETEPSRKYNFLKSLDLGFIPSKGIIYIDNGVSYDVLQIVFSDNKIGIILSGSNGDKEALDMLVGLAQ